MLKKYLLKYYLAKHANISISQGLFKYARLIAQCFEKCLII